MKSNEKELVEEMYKYGDVATFRQYGFVRWAEDHWLYHYPNRFRDYGFVYTRNEMIDIISRELKFEKEFPIEGGLV